MLLGLLLLSLAGRFSVGWAVDVSGPINGPAPGSFVEETFRETFFVGKSFVESLLKTFMKSSLEESFFWLAPGSLRLTLSSC